MRICQIWTLQRSWRSMKDKTLARMWSGRARNAAGLKRSRFSSKLRSIVCVRERVPRSGAGWVVNSQRGIGVEWKVVQRHAGGEARTMFSVYVKPESRSNGMLMALASPPRGSRGGGGMAVVTVGRSGEAADSDLLPGS